MDLLLPLISLLLIAGGGGGRQHVSFSHATMATATNLETPRAYWEGVLPGTPMPPAITDLLAQQDGEASHRHIHSHGYKNKIQADVFFFRDMLRPGSMTSARRLSESSEIVTCHDLTYPYVVYYCHTSNPTFAYTVTLESMEGGAAPATMEALAVCHLDMSQWSPRNPFFELHNVKPGDVVVCHFLTKLSIVWVRASEPGDAHAANR